MEEKVFTIYDKKDRYGMIAVAVFFLSLFFLTLYLFIRNHFLDPPVYVMIPAW